MYNYDLSFTILYCLTLIVALSHLYGLDYSSVLGRVLEWLVLVLPTLMSLTILSDFSLELNSGMLVLALTGLTMTCLQGNRATGSPSQLDSKRSSFLSNHRALMILFTTVGILAVDFPVFPRRFAKTETFGYGWMDLGVGSFTFVHGLVSPEARSIESSLGRNLSGCIPLLVLGTVRCISISLLGYHENVTEYGTHWNFFFTLASVKLLSTLILRAIKDTKAVWVSSVVICILYEGLLTFTLADWILSTATPREDILSANREGVFSSLGYLALYLAGVSWGREVFRYNKTVEELWVMLRLLVLWSVLMWISLAYSLSFFLPPSRRLANYTFFTWTLAYNLTVMTIFLVTDLLVIYLNSKPSKSKPKGLKIRDRKVPEEITTKVSGYRNPQLVSAVEYNPLFFFLLANIATGLVNMIVPTIHTDGLRAVVILVLYQAALAVIITLLYRYKIKFKFW